MPPPGGAPARRLPLYDEAAPIACTIRPEEVAERLAVIERMRADHERSERTAHGLLLHFPPREEVETYLGRFAVDEKRCCAFWGFAVEHEGGLALRWDGPPAATDLVDRLEAFFAGDGPLTLLDGLL